MTLRAVKPHYITYKTLTGTSLAHGDATPLLHWYVMIPMLAFFAFYDLHELPVFEPNEYFWKHHWDGKEERWITYARVV